MSNERRLGGFRSGSVGQTDDNVALKLRQNRLLAALNTETLELLSRDLRAVSLAQGTVIFEPGDTFEYICFPQTALVSHLVMFSDGGSIETLMIGREGAVGLVRGLGPRRSFTRAVAQIGGSVLLIRAARFEQIVGKSTVIRDLIEHYTEVLLAESQQIAACNAIHAAAPRLCRWLLQSADRGGTKELPITREFLAQMLGIQRTTVTPLAQSIQNRGLIKCGRGRITILDRRRLESCACECYHTLQHEVLPRTIGVTL